MPTLPLESDAERGDLLSAPPSFWSLTLSDDFCFLVNVDTESVGFETLAVAPFSGDNDVGARVVVEGEESLREDALDEERLEVDRRRPVPISDTAEDMEWRDEEALRW